MFGLGSSAYPDFCSFSKRIDSFLAKVGVKRLLELGTGDEQKNQEQAFKDWSLKAYEVSFCLAVFTNYSFQKVHLARV